MNDNEKCTGSVKSGADYAEKCRTSKAGSMKVDAPVGAKPVPGGWRLNGTPAPKTSGTSKN